MDECPDCGYQPGDPAWVAHLLAERDRYREELLEASQAFYMQRQRCNCWGKMSGSCPNCIRLKYSEDRITAALARDKE